MEYIPFTQYLLPNGRRQQTQIFRPKEITDKAESIIEAGYRFESEVLTTDEVSLTIVGKNADLEIEVCHNGPQVLDAIDRMICRFNFDLAAQLDNAAG